ncbi:hypothetical protein L873DRAFT_1822929 [Choiromyces venosus 120613-1]|uniref:CUE domain-containing protein n=1 Tax=Choiromyces venosus 120613-1 TaxID=1336337 RepID=A0A3N4IT54_9PEZI|nr:hypothetical protein L873DRAFT_1822929 [Choiromyces venosus 120613-1]
MASEQPEKVPAVELTGDAPVSVTKDAGESAAAKPTPATISSSSANPVPEVNTSSVAESSAENPPPKPPRPMSPQQQAQATLQEAFPSIDAAVVKAVLVASGGQIEPAFTALLSMSDPTFVEETPPPQPLRPTQRAQVQRPYADRPERRQSPGGSIPSPYITSTPQNQLEADEIYARQLADQLGAPRRAGTGRPRPGASTALDPEYETGRRKGRLHDPDSDYDSDKEHSFLDDDLPVIKENLRKGFLETQSKVNSWISDFKKRLDGDSPESSPPSSVRPSSQYARSGNRTAAGFENPGRSSRDGGYDADPRVLSDDFTHLELRDSSVQAPQPRRPKANPGLFQSSNKPTGRKVSFDERPVTISDDDMYRPPQPPRSTSAGAPARQASPSSSKWEPLKSVEPAPMDRDPFSLGDSDDERDGLVKESDAKPVSVSSAQETGITSKDTTK